MIYRITHPRFEESIRALRSDALRTLSSSEVQAFIETASSIESLVKHLIRRGNYTSYRLHQARPIRCPESALALRRRAKKFSLCPDCKHPGGLKRSDMILIPASEPYRPMAGPEVYGFVTLSCGTHTLPTPAEVYVHTNTSRPDDPITHLGCNTCLKLFEWHYEAPKKKVLRRRQKSGAQPVSTRDYKDAFEEADL